MNDFNKVITSKSDDELIKIYVNTTDYQPEFIALVEAEIITRKIPLNSLNSLRNQKEIIDEQKIDVGKQGSQFWMVFAFIASLVGGIWGIVAGYQYAYSKHKNSDGDEFFVYNETTRNYGKGMLITGCVMLFIQVILR